MQSWSLTVLLFPTALLSLKSQSCSVASVNLGDREAEFTRLNELLNMNITGETPEPAPPEISCIIQQYVPYAGLSSCSTSSVIGMSCNYCTNATATAHPEVYSFVSNTTSGTHSVILVDEGRREIVVSFRGAESIWQILSLAATEAANYEVGDNSQAKVHLKTKEYLDTIIDSLKSDLKDLNQRYPDFVIVFTGHSMGGGLATLAAPVLFHELRLHPEQMLLITYGQPRVGSPEFAKYLRSLGFPHLRVVNEKDWTPRYAIFGGFVHIGNEINIQNGIPIQCNNDELEDPKCMSIASTSINLDDHTKVGEKLMGWSGC
ncbi:hypothetical protein DSO57_1000683 [Entomophthora muscae]|uniref:Uncharacterized protein n=1 Tax=Entomophthora muscae TaxID=34485 RepID=A0ACC2TWW3_9FUNG|nr:hypothetical protein DSO57_1000683 [Entomophthora muscae]